jgi:hypothetical protein
MLKLLFFRLSRRRAVATIIGGLIILSLILTVLGTMVFVSQKYDQYQQTANKMAQNENQVQLENLVANYPGLTAVSSISCGGCTVYNMSLSNLGGVGVQIVRIYISSTGSGCTTLCVLNPLSSSPVSTSSAFQQSAQFLNAGEVNHAVLLYLPSTTGPLPSGSAFQNTILIVTSRGNVFSFQWRFQIQMGGQSQSAFSASILKVAYQMNPYYPSSGYDSANEPGHGGGGTSSKGYCHQETYQPYPAGAGYAEKLTGINYPGVQDSGVLWFVNPWVTQQIMDSAEGTNGTGSSNSYTTLYLYANITNTGSIPYIVAGGSLDLTWWGSNHISGSLIGIYYNASTPGNKVAPQFYPISTAQTVATSTSFQAIFRVTQLTVDSGNGGTWPPSFDVMFWGGASLTDNTKTSTFVGGVSLSSGLWVPVSCSG